MSNLVTSGIIIMKALFIVSIMATISAILFMGLAIYLHTLYTLVKDMIIRYKCKKVNAVITTDSCV